MNARLLRVVVLVFSFELAFEFAFEAVTGSTFETTRCAIAQSSDKRAIAQTNSTAPNLRTQVKQWSKSISIAGRLFKSKQFEQSAALIRNLQAEVESKFPTADAGQIKLLKTTYKKLSKAHQLLSKQGVKLSPLAPLPDGTQATKNANADDGNTDANPDGAGGVAAMATQVSFVNQVAPIIVSKCGNCHVSREQGGFSAASFAALDNSAMVTFGLPDQSRLIEVIESGEMPKGNRKVEPAELKVLKAWIAQGAKFDGPNAAANLSSLGTDDAPAMDIASMAPTGKETVSFGLHVAPVLLENCAECHIARNPRGNFNMANLASILRGGNAGAALKPGQSATSEILLRMKGQGREVMPPSGKLSDDKIQLVAKWIDEGARFDPGDAEIPLRAVAAKGFANSLGHEELTEVRKEASRRLWRLAFADISATTVSTENFFLMGTASTSALEDVGVRAEDLAVRVTKTLKSPTQSAFAKGNTALFVLNKRYDFSEFGKMVEKRSFGRFAISSWRSDAAESYVVLLKPGGLGTVNSDSDNAGSDIALARGLAAVHVASWNQTIPRWFADGMAYWTVAKMFRRDKRLADLERDADAALAAMKKPDDFITGGMSADHAALVGYRFVKNLQGNSKAFKKLTKSLRQNVSFDVAFNDSYGITPKGFFGKNKKSKY